MLKTAEVGTLSRAAMTARELSHFCQAREPPVGVYEIGTTMIETFLWGHPSKNRATTALKWFAKNLRMKWHMDQIEAPTPPPKSALGTQSTQAPCVEPQIISS